ncbi:hypothetical protein ACSBM8_06725 [Sphingomonas sp. ASY06-1R]
MLTDAKIRAAKPRGMIDANLLQGRTAFEVVARAWHGVSEGQ